jgi:hypothetical protein
MKKIDDEDNLYVADSGWNRIFKFDPEGKYVTSFGREGQGPGEFLGDRSHPLKISFGNDGNIYTTDSGNQRLTIFSKAGDVKKIFRIPAYLYDAAVVNSKGDIYLISKSRSKVIDCYDDRFRLKKRFLDIGFHLEFPLYKPPWKKEIGMYITDKTIKKMIAKTDHIIVLSNYSYRVFHFDASNKAVDDFVIDHELLMDDLKDRLKKSISRNKFIFPFKACLDNSDNICLFYYNSSMEIHESYRYKINDGRFVDILRFPYRTNNSHYCIDSSGNIYAVTNNSSIGIYSL